MYFTYESLEEHDEMFYNAYLYLLVLVQDECLRRQRWVFHMHSMSSQVREAAASTLV